MKAYKAFNQDLKCRDFQFEIGKTYQIDGSLLICSNGFHFCTKAESVYGYYERSGKTRICEIEAIGKIITENDKSCTDKIKIIREITGPELIDLILKGNNSGDSNSGNCNSGDSNSGDSNSGNCNSGHYNSGDSNSGRYNSGHYNSGDSNSGDSNSGRYNSGDSNSGHYNSGDSNSGDYNSGHYNSGDSNSGDSNSGHYNSGRYNSGRYNSGRYNSGDYNCGFFNTHNQYVTLFNKKTKLKHTDEIIQKLRNINVKPILTWVVTSEMTEQEKINNPSHITTGGFLRNSGRIDWTKLTIEDRTLIKSLPNYDADIFEQITGIRL